jgi:hypothetical protein
MEETGGLGENHRSVASHWQTWSHNVVHLALIEIRTHISGDRHWEATNTNFVVSASTILLNSKHSKIRLFFIPELGDTYFTSEWLLF